MDHSPHEDESRNATTARETCVVRNDMRVCVHVGDVRVYMYVCVCVCAHGEVAPGRAMREGIFVRYVESVSHALHIFLVSPSKIDLSLSVSLFLFQSTTWILYSCTVILFLFLPLLARLLPRPFDTRLPHACYFAK